MLGLSLVLCSPYYFALIGGKLHDNIPTFEGVGQIVIGLFGLRSLYILLFVTKLGEISGSSTKIGNVLRVCFGNVPIWLVCYVKYWWH